MQGVRGTDSSVPGSFTRVSLAEQKSLLASESKPFAWFGGLDQTVFAARDHLGVDQMFYSVDASGRPRFARDVEDLIDPARTATLNQRALVGHIAGPYAPHPEETFYSEIKAIPPAHLLIFESGKMGRHPFWDPASVREDSSLNLDDAAEHFRHLVQEVVADRILDEPVALTLSSGMDSNSVLSGLMAADADVLAIVLATPESPSSDEAPLATISASHFGVHLAPIQIPAEDLLPDEGIQTRRATPLFNIYQRFWEEAAKLAASSGRRRLFTGYSGDDLFSGVGSYPAADLLVTLRLTQLFSYMSAQNGHERTVKQLLRSEILSPLARQFARSLWLRRQVPLPWLRSELHDAWRERRREVMVDGWLPGRAERISRFTSGMIPQLCEELAAQTRRNGVELVHPMLDPRLVDFALSLPTPMLFDGRTDKLILRRAMATTLPSAVIDLKGILPSDYGRRAMRSRRAPLLELTKNMRAADLGYVDEPVFSEHVKGFMEGQHHAMDFWNTLTLEDWLRRWW